MDNELRSSLLQAVNALVAAENGPALYSDLQALIPVARSLNARFSDERAVFNPLVQLGLQNPESFGRVIDLIEHKRAELGQPPLARPADESFDKTAYMRDFMQQKRERERRRADIENMLRPPADALRGRARLDFMQMESNKWKIRRDDALEQARAGNGGRLSKDQQTELLKTFWSQVDRELDELEEVARAEQLKPRHLRVKR
jgi:hypothetical protein